MHYNHVFSIFVLNVVTMEEIRTLEDLTNHAGFATRTLYFVSSNIKWLDLDWFISKWWKTVNLSLYYFPFKSSLNTANMFLTNMERKFSDGQLIFVHQSIYMENYASISKRNNHIYCCKKNLQNCEYMKIQFCSIFNISLV